MNCDWTAVAVAMIVSAGTARVFANHGKVIRILDVQTRGNDGVGLSGSDGRSRVRDRLGRRGIVEVRRV
jgi:hypothetical protein